MLAAGALIGLLISRTSAEDNLLGSFSDRFAGKVKKGARNLIGQGKEMTSRALSEAASATAEGAERVGLTPQRMGRKIRRVASQVRDAVANAVNVD